jgi:hypothetical protein
MTMPRADVVSGGPAEVRAAPSLARARCRLAPRLDPWDGTALLEPAQAAEMLRVPEAEFRRDFLQGKRIPFVSLSVKRPRVRVQDLVDFVNSRTVAP